MPYLVSYIAFNGPETNIGSKVVKNLLPYQVLVDSICPVKGGVILSVNKLTKKESVILGGKTI
jgi:hypothetical protein